MRYENRYLSSFPASVQKRSNSEQVPLTAFSMKMGKHKKPKDKQIYSLCISFMYVYMFMEMKTSCHRTAISVDPRHDHVIIAEHIFSPW